MTGGLLVEVGLAGRGLPERVSPSQVSTYESCPLKYFFGQVLGWREPPTMWTVAGNLVHDTFEQLYRLPPADRTVEKARNLLGETAREAFQRPDTEPFRTDGEVAERAKASIENLFALERPDQIRVEVGDVERPVAVEVGGVAFNGRLDRFTADPFVRVTDYKTGKRPQPAHLGKALRQLLLYAVALTALGVRVAEVELLYVYANARVRRPVFDAVLADTSRAFTRMREASTDDLARGVWEARKSALCGFCSFKPACPVFRPNVPPPGTDGSAAVLLGRGLTLSSRRHVGSAADVAYAPDALAVELGVGEVDELELDRDTAVDEAEAVQ